MAVENNDYSWHTKAKQDWEKRKNGTVKKAKTRMSPGTKLRNRLEDLKHEIELKRIEEEFLLA